MQTLTVAARPLGESISSSWDSSGKALGAAHTPCCSASLVQSGVCIARPCQIAGGGLGSSSSSSLGCRVEGLGRAVGAEDTPLLLSINTGAMTPDHVRLLMAARAH